MNFTLEGSAIWLVAVIIGAVFLGAAVSCDPYAVDAAIGEAVAGVVFLVGLALGVPLVGVVGLLLWEGVRDIRKRRGSAPVVQPVAPAPQPLPLQQYTIVVNMGDGRKRVLSAQNPEALKALVAELPAPQRREITGSNHWRELNP